MDPVRPVVLVVDDDPDACDLLVEYLAFRGARPIRAANVDEADTLLAGLRVDVIVTDYSMPEKDGLSFLRAVRRTSRFATTPVVMISGHDHRGDIASAARAQGATFLSKPLDLQQLLAAIEAGLGGSSSLETADTRRPPARREREDLPTLPAPDATPRGRAPFRLPRPPRLPDVREETADHAPDRDPRREPE